MFLVYVKYDCISPQLSLKVCERKKSSQWHLRQDQMKHLVGPPALKTAEFYTWPWRFASFSSLKPLSLLFPVQQASLPRMKNLDVNPFSLPWQGSYSICFPRRPFVFGEFFLSSYGKLLHHFPKTYCTSCLNRVPLKSSGAWRVVGGRWGWVCCEIFCLTLWCELECWLSASRSLSLPDWVQ